MTTIKHNVYGDPVSYCRWSTDDYTCDLYVYEAYDGFSINVAGNRVVWKIERPPWPKRPTEEVPEGEAFSGSDWHKYVLRMRWATEALNDEANFERVQIDHPKAGESYSANTPARAREILIELKNGGFKFPYDIIDQISEPSLEET